MNKNRRLKFFTLFFSVSNEFRSLKFYSNSCKNPGSFKVSIIYADTNVFTFEHSYPTLKIAQFISTFVENEKQNWCTCAGWQFLVLCSPNITGGIVTRSCTDNGANLMHRALARASPVSQNMRCFFSYKTGR